MKKIILILCISIFAFAKSDFSEPKPSFESPRKVVMAIKNSDLKLVNATLGTIYNILKEYPSESLNVAVVIYGNGMRAIKKDYDKDTLKRITSLMEYDVEFYGCKNTMESMHWKESDFIDNINFVQAGVVEIIEKQVDGYISVNPY